MPVKGNDNIKVVAFISAESDDHIRTIVVDAIDKVRPDVVLSIEPSSLFETTIVEEGMEKKVKKRKQILFFWGFIFLGSGGHEASRLA